MFPFPFLFSSGLVRSWAQVWGCSTPQDSPLWRAVLFLSQAGNVVTGEMVEELILSGADIIKVGVGPGKTSEPPEGARGEEWAWGWPDGNTRTTHPWFKARFFWKHH